jgi:hypothetical protein
MQRARKTTTPAGFPRADFAAHSRRPRRPPQRHARPHCVRRQPHGRVATHRVLGSRPTAHRAARVWDGTASTHSAHPKLARVGGLRLARRCHYGPDDCSTDPPPMARLAPLPRQMTHAAPQLSARSHDSPRCAAPTPAPAPKARPQHGHTSTHQTTPHPHRPGRSPTPLSAAARTVHAYRAAHAFHAAHALRAAHASRPIYDRGPLPTRRFRTHQNLPHPPRGDCPGPPRGSLPCPHQPRRQTHARQQEMHARLVAGRGCAHMRQSRPLRPPS